MATLQASGFLWSCGFQRTATLATINLPRLRKGSLLSLPKLPEKYSVMEELDLRRRSTTDPKTEVQIKKHLDSPEDVPDPLVMEKMYAILEAIEDRVEMHKNIGEQRNNWNTLLLTSINMITLGAATMVAISAAAASGGASLAALKLGSTVMYLAATGMLTIMNKIQPSQLTEEQRNAGRLFKQLKEEIHTIVSLGKPTDRDVKEAMERVLALDRAYPLPLIGVMLEKFPSKVEPAVWWPEQRRRQSKKLGKKGGVFNGWNGKLEDELSEIIGVLKKKDEEDYLRLGEKALRLNKALALAGPLLTGVAALGSAFLGSPCHGGSWAVALGVIGGALASVVNTLQHGGQIGMVFEMYRNNAGFFRLMEETVEANLKESEVGRRENGDLFEMKVALQLGRSLTELRDLASSSSIDEQFGSKLF